MNIASARGTRTIAANSMYSAIVRCLGDARSAARNGALAGTYTTDGNTSTSGNGALVSPRSTVSTESSLATLVSAPATTVAGGVGTGVGSGAGVMVGTGTTGDFVVSTVGVIIFVGEAAMLSRKTVVGHPADVEVLAGKPNTSTTKIASRSL